MSPRFPSAIRQSLVSRGILPADISIEPVPGGNADRREKNVSLWKALSSTGPSLKLTLGYGLADRVAAQTAFADCCPSLVRAPLFYEHVNGSEVLGEEWFPGQMLSHIPVNISGAKTIRSTIQKLTEAFTASTQPSTPEARTHEWQKWTKNLLNDCQWTEGEKSHLQHDVLPELFTLLCSEKPQIRWSNGDLTADNILVDESGSLRLIDLEFATRTHFFAEDSVRCHTLSALARSHPDLFSALPLPLFPWHLYFWLRQFHFETRVNTNDFLDKVRVSRLGVIRRIAEFIINRPLAHWSVPAAPLAHNIETATWLQSEGLTVAINGWCHVPHTQLRAIGLATAQQWITWTSLQPRPDVSEHFSNVPHSLLSGFNLPGQLVEPEDTLTVCVHTADGTLLPFASFLAGELPNRGPAISNYNRWAAANDPDPLVSPVTTRPLFSVLLPVYRTPLPFLQECIDSVTSQHHSAWELLIVDDGSHDVTLTTALQRAAARDQRIKLLPRSENGGIARATNDALAAAKGDYVVFLDHDDRLRPHTLSTFADRLIREPNLDVLYTDEDKITATGERVFPICKPDFSPEYLLGVMYIGHALCVRTALTRACGGLDPAFDGVQDYEFLLRLTEHTKRIGHIPRILYHWRMLPGSIALRGNEKSNIDALHAAAVQSHLKRIGDSRIVHALGNHRVRLLSPAPTPPFAIIRVPSVDEIMTTLRRAAETNHADVLIAMLPECTDISDSAAREISTLATLPNAGSVAPVLLAVEGLVLEAGRTRHEQGTSPILRGFSPESDGYNGTLRCNRETAAVSPICAAVHRTLLQSTQATSWEQFVHELSNQGRRHLICAGAQVKTTISWRLPRNDSACPGQDPWWNPHFATSPADYRLVSSLIS